MNADEIKVLPEHLRDGFFGADTSGWKFNKENGLTAEEIEALIPVLRRMNPNTVWAIPEVDFPFGVKTPEIWADGVKIEVKTITDAKKIDRQVRNSKHQINGGIVVVVDKTGEIPLSDIKMAIKNTSNRRGVDNIFVQNGSIKFVTETKEKEVRELPTKGRAIMTSYTSIISQDARKVKELFDKKSRQYYHQTHKLAPESFNKPTKYWEQRSLQRTIEAEKLAKPYLARLRMEYRASSDRAIDQIRRIYETYFGEAGFDRQKLREITPSGDLSRYIKEVRSLGVALPDNYQYRVNREEFLHAQLWLEAQKLGVFEQNISNELYSKVINRSFERTFGDYGGNFARLNDQTMNEILDSKFHGKNFSTRIWGRTDRLAEELHAKLAFAIAKGEGWERTSREIRERFGVAQSSAERLIRTETNYFENRAELAAYQELGIQEFEFLAALDGRTSEICRHHHGKRYKVEKGKSGENIPPLHPNCRSTIVAVVPELERAPVVETSSQDRGVSIGVKVAKPAPVSVENAVNFNQPHLKSLDQAIIKPQAKEVDSIMKDFPAVAQYLAEKGGLNIKVSRSKKFLASVSASWVRSSGQMVKIESLNLAKNYYADGEKFVSSVEKGVKTGHFMPISSKNYKKYPISHEFGHVIQDYLMIKDGGDSRILARQHKNDILKIATEKSGLMPVQTEDKFMSKYGKSMDEEFFAEAFAGLRNGVKNPITEAMKQFLKEKF